jgi:Arc/MetJ-type ribon-helix-helix transcriptional regulator
MDVKLDAKTENLVKRELDTGRFPDAAALVSTALEHYLIAREFGEEYTREEIDSKIARGLAQLKDGQGIDGEEFFERLRRHYENLQSPRR